MLDRKKIIGLQKSAISSGHASKTDKLSTAVSNTTASSQAGGVQGLKAMLRAKRQIPTGSSMLSLLKTNDGANAGAAAKAGKRPLMFAPIKKSSKA